MNTAHLESFGARIELSAPTAEVLDEIAGAVPRARMADPGPRGADARVELAALRSGFEVAGERRERFGSLGEAIVAAASEAHFAVARHAREAVFLHAGAVALEGRLILLPGLTHAGKSTLTMALVEAGGVYYSDEYAPIDERGRVLPYRRRPSLRHGSPLAPTGVPSGVEPPPRRCDLVLGCRYQEGARWAPEPLSAGQGALLLVANAVVAQPRAAATARAAAEVVRHARCFHTPRPTARLAVEGIRRLLAELEEDATSGAGRERGAPRGAP